MRPANYYAHTRGRAREGASWELMAKQCEVGIDVLGRLIIGDRKKGIPCGLRNDSDDRTTSLIFQPKKQRWNWLDGGKHAGFIHMYAQAREDQQEYWA